MFRPSPKLRKSLIFVKFRGNNPEAMLLTQQEIKELVLTK
jgi:hypothetical protein